MRIKFLLFALSIYLFNCNPRYHTYLTLVPTEVTEDSLGATPIVDLMEDQIALQSSFIHASEFDVVFNLKISNQKGAPIYIDPNEFSFTALNENGTAFKREFAFDAEDLVFELSDNIQAAKNAKTEGDVLGWIFFGVNAIGAITSFSSGDNELGLQYSLDAGADLAITSIASSSAKKHIVTLEAERDFYNYKALRDTTLQPGESLEGLVIFPRFDPAYQLKVKYPIEEANFEIIYDQFYERVDLRPRD